MPRLFVERRSHVTAVNAGGPALRMGADGRPVGAPIATGEVLYRGPALMASAGTIPFYGFGLRMFPFAEQARGEQFQLRVADCGVIEALAHVPSLFAGSWRSPRVHDFLCDRVTLYFDRDVPCQIGGDHAGRTRILQLALAKRPVQVVA
jgi:hypothetical protein